MGIRIALVRPLGTLSLFGSGLIGLVGTMLRKWRLTYSDTKPSRLLNHEPAAGIAAVFFRDDEQNRIQIPIRDRDPGTSSPNGPSH